MGGGHLVGTRFSRRTLLRVAGVGAGVLAAASRHGATPSEGTARAQAPELRDPIADLAASLAYDVERIHRFMAEEIRYEPYVGVLRGAAGTLAAGAGNSADQATLLAALLSASGLRTRFATGELDDA